MYLLDVKNSVLSNPEYIKCIYTLTIVNIVRICVCVGGGGRGCELNSP